MVGGVNNLKLQMLRIKAVACPVVHREMYYWIMKVISVELLMSLEHMESDSKIIQY